MNSFVVQPIDPVVFGTGKPFTAIPGARLDSAPLPPPSTLAGMVRSEAGRGTDGQFDRSRIDEVLALRVRGPLPMVLDTAELVVPAPADALRLEGQDHSKHALRRLVPLRLDEGDVVSDPDLLPVGLRHPDRSKPVRGAPPWWTMRRLVAWLTAPSDTTVDATAGVALPAEEARIHVRLDPATGTVDDDGALFGTVGRRYRAKVDGMPLDLGVWGSSDASLGERMVTLGGEARLSRLQPTDTSLPEIPDAVMASARAGFLRAVLLTPADLGGGRWQPQGATVVAQTHGRPTVISGWGFAPPDALSDDYPLARLRKRRGGLPKPTRRLMPAGAVFFIELQGDASARERWLRDHWGACIGRHGNDGFGLTLFGTWGGEPARLEIS